MPIVEAIFEEVFQLLLTELKQSTRASEGNCQEVAKRIATEVTRICSESKRIQASGEIASWAQKLAGQRKEQCLHYYNLGSRQGRVELHGSLSAIVYRYITPSGLPSSYQGRLTLIEDFLQGFYIEALNALRREAELPVTYQPKTLLSLAEYMAFVERYGKRRIRLSRGRSQQLIILRAQTFSQQQPPETFVDMERAAEGATGESGGNWGAAPGKQVREVMVATADPNPIEDHLRFKVVEELMQYLQDHNQHDCADYFALRLQDLSTSEIEQILDLTSRKRDYLQQRFKYHLSRFATGPGWELVHQWLEADLERNLGMTPGQWKTFIDKLNQQQQSLLSLKQQKLPHHEIASDLGITASKVTKEWSKLLQIAWEIRNT